MNRHCDYTGDVRPRFEQGAKHGSDFTQPEPDSEDANGRDESHFVRGIMPGIGFKMEAAAHYD